MQLAKAVGRLRASTRLSPVYRKHGLHTSRVVTTTRDPNFLVKEDTFQLEWSELRNKVFGDFGKPKQHPPSDTVAFIPKREPDEEVIPKYVYFPR
jgi:hypothetical protein